MNLLLIEDDTVLGKALQQGLTEAGHTCEWTKDGHAGVSRATERSYDAIVLDLLLPDLHGLQVLAALRKRNVLTPVIILTALGSVDERVAGLNAGADDYLVKPFAFPELTARLDAICRRALAPPSPLVRVGSLTLDLATHRVIREGKEIELTPTEFGLIEFLARHAGQVVTRKMLCEHLWESDWEGVTNVIEVHINRLRAKIDRDFDQPLIQTVRGRGYVLQTS